ncbi:MAG: hypothetical protein ACTHKV_03735 [Flavipsychrobacter sp.]
MPLNLERYNQKIKSWTQQANQGLKQVGDNMGIVHRADSPSSSASLPRVKGREHFEDGAVDRIGFKMNRSLIWTHKGAGKGRGGTKGSNWITARGESKTTNPKSFGKMGTAGRTAKPWFDQFMDGNKGVDELATIAAEELGDAVLADAFKIK